jgi:hypothetical protein
MTVKITTQLKKQGCRKRNLDIIKLLIKQMRLAILLTFWLLICWG